jgi:hypothetical protein
MREKVSNFSVSIFQVKVLTGYFLSSYIPLSDSARILHDLVETAGGDGGRPFLFKTSPAMILDVALAIA